jgi:hypothetical protein
MHSISNFFRVELEPNVFRHFLLVCAQNPISHLPDNTTKSDNITITDTIIGSIGDSTSGAGYLILIEPNVLRKPTPLYAIGNKIEFIWKYAEGLAMVPKSLTIAVISPLKEQFIIGDSIPGDSKKYVWDTELFESDPQQPRLMTGKYIVRIWDERGPDAPAAVGRMIPYRQLAFSMYSKQTYQDMDSKLDQMYSQ